MDYVQISSKKIHTLVNLTGASIFRLEVCNLANSFVNIVMPLRNLAHSEQNHVIPPDPSYAGVTLGPCAGRIQGGHLPLPGKIYQLEQNDGRNHIHGGSHSLSVQLFNVIDETRDVEKDIASVTLQAKLENGIDGWPGDRIFQVTYTAGPGLSLRIDYDGWLENGSETWFDLSNHSYFNLSGDFTKSALHHLLQIPADLVLYNDTENIPHEIKSVENTPFDFRRPVSLQQQMDSYPEHFQLIHARGYNNAFLTNLNACDNDQIPTATLIDPDTGRCMHLYTNHSSLVVYSGGFLGKDTPLADGMYAFPGCAIALEAQEVPDAPHQECSHFTPLSQGEHYKRYIRLEFEM